MADDVRREVVSPEEWLAARKTLLAEEKALTRARDELTAKRRALPMVEITKDYRFEGPDGEAGLADLFDGRSQLILKHAMFAPDWDEGCPSCRHAIRDYGHLPHLHAMDTTLVAVSRAPYPKIADYRERMGWTLPYYSSYGSDFNYDFHATLDPAEAPVMVNFRTRKEHERAVGRWDCWGTELPGISVFLREDDTIYHTYSTFARGLDNLLFTFNYLDLTPYGRNGPVSRAARSAR